MQYRKVPQDSEESSKRDQAGFRIYVQVRAGNADMYDNDRKSNDNDQGLVAGILELELTRNFVKKAVRA